MNRVGFGPRFGAALIDVVIIIPVMFFLFPMIGLGSMGLGAMTGMSSPDAMVTGTAGGLALGMLMIWIFPMVYSMLEVFIAGTPGKKILGLRIANADGSPALIQTLFTRWALKNVTFIANLLSALTGVALISKIGSIGALIVFLGCFMIFGAARQALHDRIAGTAVVK